MLLLTKMCVLAYGVAGNGGWWCSDSWNAVVCTYVLCIVTCLDCSISYSIIGMYVCTHSLAHTACVSPV